MSKDPTAREVPVLIITIQQRKRRRLRAGRPVFRVAAGEGQIEKALGNSPRKV